MRTCVTVYPSSQEFDRDTLQPDRTHIFRLKTRKGIIERIKKIYGYCYNSDIFAKIEYLPEYGTITLKTEYVYQGQLLTKKGCFPNPPQYV